MKLLLPLLDVVGYAARAQATMARARAHIYIYTQMIVAHLTAGRFLDQLLKQPHIIPTSVLAVVQLSSDKNDLPNSLETLATMYQQQADLRLASLQAALTPMLLLLVAGLIAVVILGLFAPMISIFRLFN